jgi:hypothetical protein
MSAARLVAAVVVTAAALAPMAAQSYVPYAHEAAAGAELRLAWRARSARVEACRRRTPDELARLPVHMRQELVCERGVAPYRLRVEVDDATLVDRPVAAAGARADRPLYVFEELPLAPGTHRVNVAFIREGDTEEEMEEDESEEADARRTAPATLTLDTVVVLAAGRAALITYDEDARRLHVVTRH